MIYRDARLDAFREQCNDTKRSTGHNSQSNNCQSWPRVVLALEGRVYERGMNIFMDADALFQDVAERVGCDTIHYIDGSATGCVPKLALWKAQFQEILSGLPSLSSILSGLNQ